MIFIYLHIRICILIVLLMPEVLITNLEHKNILIKCFKQYVGLETVDECQRKMFCSLRFNNPPYLHPAVILFAHHKKVNKIKNTLFSEANVCYFTVNIFLRLTVMQCQLVYVLTVFPQMAASSVVKSNSQRNKLKTLNSPLTFSLC